MFNILSEYYLLLSQSLPFVISTHKVHYLTLLMNQERNGPLWQYLTQLEKMGVNSHALPFLFEGNHREGSLMALSNAALCKG